MSSSNGPEWLNDPVINIAEIARRMGITRAGLHNKIKGNQGVKFSDEQLIMLENIRLELAKKLEKK